MFAINDINNGTTNSIKGMPMKDITSDGNSNFAINRSKYFETLETIPTSISQTKQKKWYGGTKNKDASSITSKNKFNQIGIGSFNAKKELSSYTSQKNIQIDPIQKKCDALRKVRSAGYVTTPKVRNSTNHLNGFISHRPTYGHNLPKLIRSENKSVVFYTGKDPLIYHSLF